MTPLGLQLYIMAAPAGSQHQAARGDPATWPNPHTPGGSFEHVSFCKLHLIAEVVSTTTPAPPLHHPVHRTTTSLTLTPTRLILTRLHALYRRHTATPFRRISSRRRFERTQALLHYYAIENARGRARVLSTRDARGYTAFQCINEWYKFTVMSRGSTSASDP